MAGRRSRRKGLTHVHHQTYRHAVDRLERGGAARGSLPCRSAKAQGRGGAEVRRKAAHGRSCEGDQGQAGYAAKAIAIDERETGIDAAGSEPATASDAVHAPTISGNKLSSAASSLMSLSAGSSSTPHLPTSPRDGSKLAQVIRLLRREDGATLAELAAATGWLPHTTRAALTGLRKRGYAVALERTDKERGSTYIIGSEDVVVADEKQTVSGDGLSSQATEPLAMEAPAASAARSETAVRSAKRERAVRSPKRKAA